MSNLLSMIQMHDQMTRPSDYERVKALTDAWNRGDLKVGENITRNEAEILAANAFSKGLDFDVKSKAGRKFAFNLADTATFGLLPDAIFKPSASVGEMYHGQSSADSIASNAGSLLGLAAGGYGLVKGAGAAGRFGMQYGKPLASKAKERAMNFGSTATQKATELANRLRSEYYNKIYFRGQNTQGSLFDLVQPGYRGAPLGL